MLILKSVLSFIILRLKAMNSKKGIEMIIVAREIKIIFLLLKDINKT